MEKRLLVIFVLILITGIEARPDYLEEGDYIKAFVDESGLLSTIEGYLINEHSLIPQDPHNFYVEINATKVYDQKSCTDDISYITRRCQSNHSIYDNSSFLLHAIIYRGFIYNIVKLDPPINNPTSLNN